MYETIIYIILIINLHNFIIIQLKINSVHITNMYI